MDERWRVPDARYKTGYRWTPRGRQAKRMNEIKRGSAPAMLFQKPANPLVDGIGDLLEPLLGNGEFIAECNLCVAA